MLSCYRYLHNNILINLTLYYLITTSTFITNTSTVLITLISLFRYLFINSFTSDLSDRSTEIAFIFKYNIFIVFIDLGTPFRRLLSIFNSNIRFFSDILSISPYLININRLDIFIFLFLSFLWPFLSSRSWPTDFYLNRKNFSLLFIRS